MKVTEDCISVVDVGFLGNLNILRAYFVVLRDGIDFLYFLNDVGG